MQVIGRLSHHAARNPSLAPAVLAIPLRVIKQAFLARLVPRVAAATRRAPTQLPVPLAAIDLTAIAAGADHEDRPAPWATRLAPRLAFVTHVREGRDDSLPSLPVRARVTTSGTLVVSNPTEGSGGDLGPLIFRRRVRP